MIKAIIHRFTQISFGYGILIVILLLLLMFILGMCIGFLLNHQNPLKLFEYQTWYYFMQLFGG